MACGLPRSDRPIAPRTNAELNRQVGLRRIAEATVEQLKMRLEHAERWLVRTA
jgi:hypothetical protein